MYRSEIKSKLLGARIYTGDPQAAGNDQGLLIVSVPSDTVAYVRGYVLGLANEFAYFAHSQAAFQSAPVGTYPLYVDAIAVPVGSTFEFYLSPNQSLFALGSTSPNVSGGVAGDEVWVTFQISYYKSDGDAGGVSGAKFTGPRPGWLKS